MDDLKLCGKNERQLMSLINTVHILKKKKKWDSLYANLKSHYEA